MSAPSRPARQVCPLCSRDDLIAVEPMGPGVWQYTCANRKHGSAGFAWQATATQRVDEPPDDDKAARLGMYDDLPACLVPGEPFLEYGVVEHRFSQRRPDVYQKLIDDYSHTRLQRRKPYTASVFIALALGRLAKHGEVLYRVGPATGYWSYNEVISYWALPPGPVDVGVRLTWAQYAEANGLDPLA
jgi:hypothetical protein